MEETGMTKRTKRPNGHDEPIQVQFLRETEIKKIEPAFCSQKTGHQSKSKQNAGRRTSKVKVIRRVPTKNLGLSDSEKSLGVSMRCSDGDVLVGKTHLRCAQLGKASLDRSKRRFCKKCLSTQKREMRKKMKLLLPIVRFPEFEFQTLVDETETNLVSQKMKPWGMEKAHEKVLNHDLIPESDTIKMISATELNRPDGEKGQDSSTTISPLPSRPLFYLGPCADDVATKTGMRMKDDGNWDLPHLVPEGTERLGSSDNVPNWHDGPADDDPIRSIGADPIVLNSSPPREIGEFGKDELFHAQGPDMRHEKSPGFEHFSPKIVSDRIDSVERQIREGESRQISLAQMNVQEFDPVIQIYQELGNLPDLAELVITRQLSLAKKIANDIEKDSVSKVQAFQSLQNMEWEALEAANSQLCGALINAEKFPQEALKRVQIAAEQHQQKMLTLMSSQRTSDQGQTKEFGDITATIRKLTPHVDSMEEREKESAMGYFSQSATWVCDDHTDGHDMTGGNAQTKETGEKTQIKETVNSNHESESPLNPDYPLQPARETLTTPTDQPLLRVPLEKFLETFHGDEERDFSEYYYHFSKIMSGMPDMNEEKMLVNLTLFLKGSAFEALVSYTRGAEPYVTLNGVLDHMRQTFDRRPETTDALVKNLNQGLEENIRQFLVRLVI